MGKYIVRAIYKSFRDIFVEANSQEEAEKFACKADDMWCIPTISEADYSVIYEPEENEEIIKDEWEDFLDLTKKKAG